MLSKQHETTVDIPISFSNFPADLIAPSSPPEKISIRVKTPGFSLLLYNFFNFSVLDLDISASNAKPSKNGKEIFWLMNSKRKKVANVLGSSMEILDISPSRLSILAKNKAFKRIPIKLQNNITLKAGYWFSKPIQLLPDSVTIYGHQLQLDTVKYVLTKELDITNLSDNKRVIINLEDIDDVSCNPGSVDVIISVESFVEEKILKTINVKNLKQGYSIRLFPENVAVTVRVPRDKYLFLKTDFLTVEVDAQEISSEINTLDVLINNLPSSIKLQMIHPEKVEYLLIKE